MCETWENKLAGHSNETDRRIDRMSQEVNARTTILATDLVNHIDKTDKDIEAIRQQVTQVKEQISTEITNE